VLGEELLGELFVIAILRFYLVFVVLVIGERCTHVAN
jgi:hypothetical protein